MTQINDTSRDFRLSQEYQPQKFFKHAVYNHWDPYDDIPQELLVDDREKLIDHGLTDDEFEEFMNALALFGAGEEAVTEDLAPLMSVLDDVNDQMYISSQIYEEAKHTQFFDRYWREVVFPVAEELGFEKVYPTDQRFFMDGYVSLFDKNESAMERLLEEDTPETRAEAYCHYHLTVEGVVAQTAYYGFESAFSPRADDISAREYPNLEGLIEGTSYVRSDEGRHVGFGMFKIQELLEDGVDETVIHETMTDLLPDVFGTFEPFELLFKADALVDYASDKFDHRMDTITDDDRELPPVEELVQVEK
ncbi:ribonucleoside-diphosphate reductase [Halorussus lipolyticus]|uniref:ribonucleoside-diphosphate reductase n=1 Tax=Halorussus lipolyticus TaxID=3034024 RepID=UPI0023E8C4B7|nr:ribonucleoside-diphosphate reductase [Halorussus sp. DT80]